MGRLRRLDDEFLAGSWWQRPRLRTASLLLLGAVAGAVGGGVAWPLLALGYSRSDYSVVALPFFTVPVGAVVGLVLSGVLLVNRHGR